MGSAGRASSKARRALTPANTIEGANWNAAIREFESGLRAAGSEGTHREGEADPEGGPALPGWARSKELDLSVPAASMGKDSTPLSRSAPAEVRRVVEGGIPSPVAGGNEEADGRSPGGKPRGGGGLSVGRSRARGGWHGQRAQRVRATLWNQLTPAVPDSVRARVAVRQAPRTWDKQTLALNDKSWTAAAGEIDESPEGCAGARARNHRARQCNARRGPVSQLAADARARHQRAAACALNSDARLAPGAGWARRMRRRRSRWLGDAATRPSR